MFYVYKYVEPNLTPMYIGKGFDSRAYQHLKTAHRTNTAFARAIMKLRANGLEPSVIIVEKDLAEGDAFTLERKLIADIGRRVKNTGPLYNVAKGGNGGAGPRSSEVKAKISSSLKGTKKSAETRNRMCGRIISPTNLLKLQSRIGDKNPAAKLWVIKDPYGNVLEIKSLHTFCNHRNLTYPTLVKTLGRGKSVVSGKSAGWQVLSVRTL